ncbi:MAG: hypothetical protein R3C49_25615 [Planctomycetaceae bacterium]
MSIWKYIRKAFANHWNLLGLAGATAFTAISGNWDVGLPLIAAGEVAWLTFVGTHPRFRQYVDIQEHQASKANQAEAVKTQMDDAGFTASHQSAAAHDALKHQCDEMRAITKQYPGSSWKFDRRHVHGSSAEGLDRLL